MQLLQLVSTEEKSRNTAIALQRLLDDARTKAMENLLNSGPLSSSLSDISHCLENILGCCHCQVLSFEATKNKFSPTNDSHHSHASFVAHIMQLLLNKGQTEVTQNISNLSESIYSDIYESNTWRSLHLQGKELGIVAAWIVPLISAKGSICGAYLCLFNTVREANKSDLDILRRATSSFCAMLFNDKQKKQDFKNTVALQKHVSKQQEDLEEIRMGLEKALRQRAEVQTQLVDLENMAALGTMMSSLTHEVNTPIGVSLTASSFLYDLQEDCLNKIKNNQLKRSELIHYVQESTEASYIIQHNILRADALIKTFKRLSIDQDSQDVRCFYLCHYVYEVLLSLKPKLKHMPHRFCIDISNDLNIVSNPGALSQILINLIMNSIDHAFLPKRQGQITIKAQLLENENELLVVYKDNGIGMHKETIENMYKPFFTLTGNNEGTGLGMHICNNIVMKILKGSIRCESEPGEGTTFFIQIPV